MFPSKHNPRRCVAHILKILQKFWVNKFKILVRINGNPVRCIEKGPQWDTGQIDI